MTRKIRKIIPFPLNTEKADLGEDEESDKLDLRFKGEALDELERLRLLGGDDKLSDVVSGALGVYAMCVDHIARGGKVLFEDPPLEKMGWSFLLNSSGIQYEVQFPRIRRRD